MIISLLLKNYESNFMSFNFIKKNRRFYKE